MRTARTPVTRSWIAGTAALVLLLGVPAAADETTDDALDYTAAATGNTIVAEWAERRITPASKTFYEPDASPQDSSAVQTRGDGWWICVVDGEPIPGSHFAPLGWCRAEPAPVSVEGTPIVVTASDVSRLIVGGSGLVRQPPGEQVVVTMDLIVYTDPSPRTMTTTVGGTAVTVTATPISYTWHWGDGTTTTTTDPGAPYPNQTVVHRYQRRDKGVVVSLTTSWTATFTVEGDATARPVSGTITTTETSTPFNLVRLVSVLTDDAEEAQGH